MCWLAGHKSVATATAGYPQLERLQFFVNAVARRGGRNSSTRLNLPPLAVFAQSPCAASIAVLAVAAMVGFAIVMMSVSHDLYSF